MYKTKPKDNAELLQHFSTYHRQYSVSLKSSVIGIKPECLCFYFRRDITELVSPTFRLLMTSSKTQTVSWWLVHLADAGAVYVFVVQLKWHRIQDCLQYKVLSILCITRRISHIYWQLHTESLPLCVCVCVHVCVCVCVWYLTLFIPKSGERHVWVLIYDVTFQFVLLTFKVFVSMAIC